MESAFIYGSLIAEAHNIIHAIPVIHTINTFARSLVIVTPKERVKKLRDDWHIAPTDHLSFF